MLNDPVNLVDPWGLRTDFYVWQGVGFGTSAFGHTSIGINGTSYSWGPNGMDIRPLNDYIKHQSFRDGIKAPINLTPDQEKAFEDFLRKYGNDNTYWFPGNVCTDPINKGLQSLGFDFDLQLVPMSLYLELIRRRILG